MLVATVPIKRICTVLDASHAGVWRCTSLQRLPSSMVYSSMSVPAEPCHHGGLSGPGGGDLWWGKGRRRVIQGAAGSWRWGWDPAVCWIPTSVPELPIAAFGYPCPKVVHNQVSCCSQTQGKEKCFALYTQKHSSYPNQALDAEQAC